MRVFAALKRCAAQSDTPKATEFVQNYQSRTGEDARASVEAMWVEKSWEIGEVPHPRSRLFPL
jgi:hypothetical protein